MKQKQEKVGRNEPCPCGSGKKYKKCCMMKNSSKSDSIETLYLNRHKIRLKKEADIICLRRVGQLVVDTLELVASEIRPGLTTDDINTIVHEYTLKNNAKPAPL